MKGFLLEIPPDQEPDSSVSLFLYVPDSNNFLLSAETTSVGKRLKVESSEDSQRALVYAARRFGFIKEVEVPFNLVFTGLMMEKLENDSGENYTRFGSYCTELRQSFTLSALRLDVGGTDLHSFFDLGRVAFQESVVEGDSSFEFRARQFLRQL